MRISGLVGLFAALVFAQAAHASVDFPPCMSGCTTDASGYVPFGTDYTAPTDGGLYRWDLWSDLPNVLISVAAPNEVFGFQKVSNGDGTFHSIDFTPTFQWTETQSLGHTVIIVGGAADFDTCSASTPLGVVRGAQNFIWGNGEQIKVNVPEVVHISGFAAAIPEPAGWGLMLTGFFGLGLALRRGRRTAGRLLAA
jgi:hypothetical protein